MGKTEEMDMGRWTINDDEVRHLTDLWTRKIEVMDNAEVESTVILNNGEIISGRIFASGVRNNAGEDGSGRCRMDIVVKTSKGDRTIDGLDVADIVPGQPKWRR